MCALDDQFGNLCHVPGDFVLQVFLLVLHNQERKQDDRRRQRDGEIEADLELE